MKKLTNLHLLTLKQDEISLRFVETDKNKLQPTRTRQHHEESS